MNRKNPESEYGVKAPVRATVDELVANLEAASAKMQAPTRADKPEAPPAVFTEVERSATGTKIMVPEDLKLDEAIDAIRRHQSHTLQDDQDITVSETFECLPYEGAHALYLTLRERFGWTSLQSAKSKGFFGETIETPPTMLSIPVGINETVQVPWGEMQLPGVKGWLATDVGRNNEGRFVFTLSGTIVRKHEKTFQALGAAIRQHLREDALYKGKAFRIRFTQVDARSGKEVPAMMPEPRFLDLSAVREDELIFPQLVMEAVETSIFTPIERAEDCRRHGIPLKRGVLLAGPFGVGKSMTAYVTAAKAQAHGWTFIYAERAIDLHDALRLASSYMPAVVFCEDIDRAAKEGKRTESTEQLLNILDGVDSKNTELLVVFTTNQIDDINPAMLRPGRLDAVIVITPPDAEAAERLVRLYGRDLVTDGPLSESCQVLEGSIPAVIREAVERAKLAVIRSTPAGGDLLVSDAALAEAARGMKQQRGLLVPKVVDTRSDIEKAAGLLVDAIRSTRPLATPSHDGVRVEA